VIPKNITREHVIKAIEEIERNGVPRGREPKKFVLLYKGRTFPPKYVISLANKYANGVELDPSKFYGGAETNIFLINLGFEVLNKDSLKRLSLPDQIEIEPEKPFTSLMQVYNLMESLTGIILILDKHFNEDGFKFLRKLKPIKVKEIRILMGKTHLNKDFKDVYKAFKDEMFSMGVKVQCRVLWDKDEKEIHDRYLISRDSAYNTPPWKIIHKKFGDIIRIKDAYIESKRKRFEKYWSRATDILKMSLK